MCWVTQRGLFELVWLVERGGEKEGNARSIGGRKGKAEEEWVVLPW